MTGIVESIESAYAVYAEHVDRGPAIRLSVNSVVHGDEEPAEELLRMDNNEMSDESPEDGDLAVEQLKLTLRVELAARRMSISELSRLRAGQIIDLGCHATDPVDLVSEGRPLARGELVDIEGRLGVRITQVYHAS